MGVGFIHHGKLLHLLQAKQHFGLLERDRRDGTRADVYERAEETMRLLEEKKAKKVE